MSVLVGYARVSKADGSQSLDLQRDHLIAAGVEPSRIYEDRASGRKDARPGLQECLRALQPGNTLVIWKLDRLGRDLRHLISTVDDLRKRDVGFRVIAGQGAAIDTTTHNGRLFFGVFAVLAEYERELIAERTKAGLQAARARGRMGGRPPKMGRKTIEAAQALLKLPDQTAQGVAKHLNISTATLYTYLNGDGTLKENGQVVVNRGR